MKSTEMMWRAVANGQKVMGRECLELARYAKTTEEVRECVDLANKCALIESSCVERAKLEAGRCAHVKDYVSPVTGDVICRFCGA